MSQTHTDPPVPPAPATPGQGADGFFDSVRRIGMVRTQDRWVGGVAGGLARRFAIDPLLVRGLLAASVLLGGFGLVLYGIAWLLLPEEADGRIHTQQLLRGDVNAAVIGGVATIVVGLTVPNTWSWTNSDALGWIVGLMWMSTIALIVVVVVVAARGRGTGTGPSTTLPRTAPPAPAAFGPTAPATGPAAPSTPFTPAPPAAPFASPADATPTTAEAATADATSTGGTMSTSSTLDDTASTGPAPYGQGGYNGGYNGGGYGAGYGGGYGGWTPPPAGPTTSLPRTEPSGTGAAIGVATALTLITLASLLYAQRTGYYDGPVGATTIAVGVGLLGVGIVVQALRGRSSGGLTALAIVGALVAVPAVGVSTWDGSWDSDGTAVGDISATPSTVQDAESGLQVGAGSAVLDLRQVPLDQVDAITVPIRVGAGDVTVLLPDGVASTVSVSLGLGEVTWVDGSSTDGIGNEVATYRTQAAVDGDPVELALDVQVGLGSITFEER